jgi:CarD family transcriptional regulator
MAARKKSNRKSTRSNSTRAKRAIAGGMSTHPGKRGGPAEAPSKARGARKVVSASRASSKSSRRKRRSFQEAGSAKVKNTMGSRLKGAERKTVASKNLGKVNKTVAANAEASAMVKARTKRAEAKLRSKQRGKDQRLLTSAQNGPAAIPSVRSTAAENQKPVAHEEALATPKPTKVAGQRQGFKLNEFVVYPAHGVGQIIAIEEQEVAGFRLELFVISFSKDKLTLRVPTSKVMGVGMRKISDPDTAKRSLEILTGRARVKRTMWSRRAQEYETKINSGDIRAIAEVVRDLYRSDAQPEQSYSERQLYEAALDRMVREIAAVHKSNEIDALKAVEAQLQKSSASKPMRAQSIANEINQAA